MSVQKSTKVGPPTSTTSLDHKWTPGLMLAHAVAMVLCGIIIRAALDFQDATDALAFYGVYHREPWNQVIHFFGVPGILFSMDVFLAHLKIPILSNNPTIIGVLKSFYLLPEGHQFTYATLLSWFYGLFYLKIDPFGGLLYAPVLYGMYQGAVVLTFQDQQRSKGQSWMGTGKLLAASFVLHVFSWWIQIAVGHQIIEGAQPASLQSLGGALTVAPLFAFYEGLWMAGINKGLQAQTLELVNTYTLELCASGKVAMRACASLNS